MTEKEFLITFIEHAEAMGHLGKLSTSNIDQFLNNFLEYHHQTYYEVEFVRKGCELDGMGIVQHSKDCKNDCTYKQ